jgi:hypothetical protein
MLYEFANNSSSFKIVCGAAIGGRRLSVLGYSFSVATHGASPDVKTSATAHNSSFPFQRTSLIFKASLASNVERFSGSFLLIKTKHFYLLDSLAALTISCNSSSACSPGYNLPAISHVG